jgi:hypothetical protein
MHKALRCTCSLKFPPFSFNIFLSVLQQYNLITIAVFLNLSLIVDCSIIFIPMCLQSAAYHASSFSPLLSIFFLFISCMWPPPVWAHLLPQKICLLDQLFHYPPTFFNSSCAYGWFFYNFFLHGLLPLFSLLVYWHGNLFSAAKD